MRVQFIKSQLEKWQAASEAISCNKSYTVDGLTVTKQDAETVEKQIVFWSGRLAAVLCRKGSSFGVSKIRFSDGHWCRR